MERAAETHYPTMSLGAICALPIGDPFTVDAALFLWTTAPHLMDANIVIETWGFKYTTHADLPELVEVTTIVRPRVERMRPRRAAQTRATYPTRSAFNSNFCTAHQSVYGTLRRSRASRSYVRYRSVREVRRRSGGAGDDAFDPNPSLTTKFLVMHNAACSIGVVWCRAIFGLRGIHVATGVHHTTWRRGS